MWTCRRCFDRLVGRPGAPADVASAAGTSQAAIAAYEGGRKSPSLGTLDRVASAMGTGLRVELVFPADRERTARPFEVLTREERRSLWLHRAIAARIQADPGRAMSVARENLAVMGSEPARPTQGGSGGRSRVPGHVKADGTRVKGYWRT